jgi:hypothetical protein
MNVLICFPGGTGGHFIGALVKYLSTKQLFKVSENGDVHSFNCSKFLEGILLDHSVESYSQEFDVINKLFNFDIAIGHFRNLAVLEKQIKKIIYISFEPNDIDDVSQRLISKITDISESQYNLLAGANWPAYYDYLNGTIVNELVDLRLKFLSEWYYIIPSNRKNLCEIKFIELTKGYDFVDKLAEFLDVKDFDNQKIYAIIDEYRNKNRPSGA